MKIRTKLNLSLIGVFIFGTVLAATVSYRLLQDNAREEVIRSAGLLMQTALSIRNYTSQQVKPKLVDQLSTEFLPQTVPAFAATETLAHLQISYPSYSYREATLNPTNPRDKAQPWEASIVRDFRKKPQSKELILQRNTQRGELLYIARPIKITNQGCLACHSTPDVAPPSMLAKYGDSGGFGWKMNEVVGVQLVSVPMALARKHVNEALGSFLVSIAIVFIAIFIVLNLVLGRVVVAPIVKMSHDADQISRGNFEIPRYAQGRADEIGALGESFNRLRVSLQKAIAIIQSKTAPRS